VPDVLGATTFCSVFSHHPCAPTACSVFRHRPCRPFYGFPLGENLQVTVESTDDAATAPQNTGREQGAGASELNTLREVKAALRGCWRPPPKDIAQQGMQMSVRFSFTREGKLKGRPRVTYFTAGASEETKHRYEDAIDAALDRCTPMSFTSGLGGAIAGRPIALRVIDNRNPNEDPR
jgi:hypothetical protein